MEIRRGDIFWITNDYRTGSEQAGTRPALVVSNDTCNQHSPVIQMVPLTCARKKPLPVHIRVEVDGRSCTVLCEQISSVSKERLLSYKAHLGERDMRSVERAMRIQLGMEGA